MVDTNANTHGAFVTSQESDDATEAARGTAADFLGCDADEVSFGANMTTLTLLLAQALRREMKPGDEVLITELDHEANRGPWEQLAEHGIVVREVPVDTATCTLDWDAFESLVSERTRVIAVGYASNAVGTVNDVRRAAALAHEAGAFSVIDAVHYALHGPIDVRALGVDFLLCSAYKFFGPHVGIMYARRAAGASAAAAQAASAGRRAAAQVRDRHARLRGHRGRRRGHRVHRRHGPPPRGRARRRRSATCKDGGEPSWPACSPPRPTSSRSLRSSSRA